MEGRNSVQESAWKGRQESLGKSSYRGGRYYTGLTSSCSLGITPKVSIVACSSFHALVCSAKSLPRKQSVCGPRWSETAEIRQNYVVGHCVKLTANQIPPLPTDLVTVSR